MKSLLLNSANINHWYDAVPELYNFFQFITLTAMSVFPPKIIITQEHLPSFIFSALLFMVVALVSSIVLIRSGSKYTWVGYVITAIMIMMPVLICLALIL